MNYLMYRNRRYNLAGRGAANSCLVYLDAGTGDELKVHEAEIVHSGTAWAIAQVPDNHALSRVRVDHTAVQRAAPGLRVGDRVLIGPLDFPSDGPQARAAWIVNPTPPRLNGTAQRRPTRLSGFVVAPMKPSFAFVRTETGQDYFAHISEWRGPLQPGNAVTFTPTRNGERFAAKDVRPV